MARRSTTPTRGTASAGDPPTQPTVPSDGPPRRADARRNEQILLDAAAAVFVSAGVHAPVRQIAAKAGVGMGTVYRHFPTRSDLIVAVFRHQVDTLVVAGPALLTAGGSPYAALVEWIDEFVDFLVTKRGLAEALASSGSETDSFHAYFIDRLVPVADELLAAALAAGEIRPGVRGLELMRAVGNLCHGGDDDPRYDARRMVTLLVSGLVRSHEL